MRRFLLALFALLLSLPAHASITGVVVNPDGQPVAGAKVSLCAPETIDGRRERLMSKTPARPSLATTTTDKTGAFHFDSPKDHPVVDVQVEASGFAPDTVRLQSDDDAGAIPLVTAPMQQGTITANGKPVAGATVVWIGNSADSVSTTDAQGHYSAPDPSKWASRLAIAAPGFAIYQETMRNGGAKSLDRTLSTGVAISGHVVGPDGKTPVAMATLTVDDLPLATTADDGSFTIAHAPGDWQELEARSGSLAGVRVRTTGVLPAIRVAPVGTLTGTVIDAATRVPLVDAEVRLGPDMPLRRFRGFAGNGQADIESALTDSKGAFTLAVPPGRYTLTAIYPNSTISEAAVAVVSGKILSKPLYGIFGARVSGTVIDDQNHAVAGAHLGSRNANRGGGPMIIRVGRMQGRATAISGPDGAFVLHDVTPDLDLKITADKKGMPAATSTNLRFKSGEVKTGVVLTIAHGVVFSGKVTDGNGRPLSGVSVETAESAAGGRGFGAVRRMVRIATRNQGDDDTLVRTAGDGTFSLRLKEGTYDVVFTREGFADKTLRAQRVSATSQPVLVKLDPGVAISGRVVRGGVGIEGVLVAAISMGGFANTTTASDGSFTLTDLTPGQMMLNATKPDDLIFQNRPVTAPASDVVIDVPPGGQISGKVIDKNTNAPVTSFQAGISASRGAGGIRMMMPPMLKQFTSDDGTFVLQNVPPGPTELIVSAPGYSTQHVPGLNVENGKQLSDIEVDLGSGATLTGRVTATDGTPLVGANVSLDSGAPGGRMLQLGGSDTTATTDPNGQYSLDSIDSGQQTFVFTKDGYLSATRTVNITGKSAQLDVQLSSGIPLTGMVVTDAGAPVPDANVNARSASDASFGRQTQTDAGGNFQITGVAPGHYTITADKEGLAEGIIRDFDATTGAPARVVMISGGTITGHVTGLSDAELQQATVTATGTNGSAQAPIDGSGSYQITGAPTGTVRVSARAGGIASGRSSTAQSVEVDPGSTVQVDLQFPSATVVSGHVTQNGQPVANANVLFMPRSGQQTSSSGTTDANGMYSINGLADGTYAVSVVDLANSAAFSGSYTVSGSGTYDIDVKSATLTGTVVDSTTGEPVADAQVQLLPIAGATPRMSMLGAQTDPSGAFTINNVQSGSYQATAQKSGYGQDMKTVVVGDTPPDALQFKIAPSDGVTLNVVDGRDNTPLAANVLRVVDAQGNTIDIGGFRFSSTPEPVKLTLAPGQYSVTLEATGYAPQVVTVTSPSTQTVAMTPGGTLVLRSKSSTTQNVRLIMPNGSIYPRGPNGVFALSPSPLTTTLENVSPGQYTLQVLDSAGNVTNTIPVTVVEGQQNEVDV